MYIILKERKLEIHMNQEINYSEKSYWTFLACMPKESTSKYNEEIWKEGKDEVEK